MNTSKESIDIKIYLRFDSFGYVSNQIKDLESLRNISEDIHKGIGAAIKEIIVKDIPKPKTVDVLGYTLNIKYELK